MVHYENMTIDTDSSLYKIYTYFWDNPDSKVIPNEIMPVHHAIYYTYINVKNLRDGTDWHELTLEELEKMFDEEFPNWEEDWEELPDEAYAQLGINIPIRKNNDED